LELNENRACVAGYPQKTSWSRLDTQEYLVNYGSSGDFGRFRPVSGGTYRRGDRVVIRNPEGLDLGVVLCPATPGHARLLSRTALGELLRPAAPEDEEAVTVMRDRANRIFDDGRRLAATMNLPLEILDAGVLLDGTQATIYHLRREECDYRPLVKALSTKYKILVVMQNLALPAEAPEGSQGGGCGEAGCGKAGGGGCTSCGAGGCATACGTGARNEEVAAALARIRQQGGGPVSEQTDGRAAVVRDLSGDSEICDCLSVTKERVVAAIRDGARTVESLGEATQAGTGCGTCQPLLRELLGCYAEPDAAGSRAGGEEDLRAYFAGLRRKMERRRTPLL
jgi:bacterioferritin-associated ferredoxin